MYRNGDCVVMEVWDAERTPPRRIEPHDDGGRGLMLVEALTQGWGYRWPLTDGKIVWCRL
jgi:two-component sensor histidine kinase